MCYFKNASWFYGEGLIRKAPSHTSCWSYRGQQLPYTPYKERKLNLKKTLLQAKEYNLLSINTGKQVVAPSVIKIEKVNGPVLLFSTKADTVWPSAESGEKLDLRLTQTGFPFRHKHICFTFMSHLMLEHAPGFARLLFQSENKYPKECAEERKRMGDEAANWLETVW